MQLFLDDERDPNTPFWREELYLLPGEWHWVKTVKEAIECLKTGNVKTVSLDHDLGQYGTQDGIHTSGYDVAKWIEEHAYYKTLARIDWHVHTANPVGFQKIATALMNASKYWDANEKYSHGC